MWMRWEGAYRLNARCRTRSARTVPIDIGAIIERLIRSKLIVLAALLFVAALHYTSIPRTLWEYDECLYAAAVEKFEPLLHHPPPPGSPVYIAFVKILALARPDALAAMLATSILAVAGGFLAFVLAFSAITDLRTGTLAAVLLYTCPAVLVSGTLPQADSGALALLGLAIWSCTRILSESKNPWRAALCGLLCAVCIGWRVQLSIAVVPMFFAAMVMMRSWRDRFIAVTVFGLACLAWLVPLVISTGGPVSFWGWLSGQAKYFAAHDADLSRSGHSPAHIALRFVAHPWGPKWLSLPLLVLALAGIRRNRRLLPLAIGALVYLGFAIATMDPADAVRYAIPSLPLVALLAPSAFTRFRHLSLTLVAMAVVVLYAIGSFRYAYPVLHARATSVSPPVLATRWIKANVPRNAIVLYDLPLRPHAEYLLPGWKTLRIDEGSGQDAAADPNVPIVLLADGEREDAVTFRWPDTDAYRKLTRNHYRAVSILPLPPERRLRVVEGVFPPERSQDGQAWRWLGARAIIELPRLGARSVRLHFRTPPEYPYEENHIFVQHDGFDSLVTIRRNATAQVIVPLTGSSTRIVLIPEQTFVPARVLGANNRDQRTLSVMLTRVEQLR
jgi:hypothetical protein